MKLRLVLVLLLAGAYAALVAAAESVTSAPDAELRVFVIRHANAWKNVPAAQRPHRMSDDELDALTPAGVTRAEQIGAGLAGKGVVAVYCSPARRARQTADAIARKLGLAAGPQVEESFRSLDPGPDKSAASGTLRMKSWKAGKDPRPPGGESLGDGFARASTLLRELRAKHPGQTIAVVTHGEISAALLAKTAGEDIVRGYFDHFPDEGSVHEISVDDTGGLGTAK